MPRIIGSENTNVNSPQTPRIACQWESGPFAKDPWRRLWPYRGERAVGRSAECSVFRPPSEALLARDYGEESLGCCHIDIRWAIDRKKAVLREYAP